MYKLAGFLRYLPGIDKDKARRHWIEVHGPMIAQIPGLEHYVQNDILEPLPLGSSNGDVPFDGYIAQWYPDRATLETAMESAEWAAVMEDGATIIDVDTAIVGPVEERVLKDGEYASFKTVGIAYFPEGMEKKAASDYWTMTHGPLTLEAGGFTRYVQNHAIPDSEWNLALDGFAEHWFTDRATYLSAVESPGWQALEEDGPNFIDVSKFWGASVNERVVKG